MQDQFHQLVTTAISRRTMFKGALGATGAAGVLLTGDPLFKLGYEFAQGALAQGGLTDLDILNFALGLELLEQRMYALINMSGKATGEVADQMKAFGGHEDAHVQALTKALTDAKYANIAKAGTYNFGTLNSQDDILKLITTVEPVGVGAYTGAAKLLKDKTLVGVAGSIVQVEARHTALARAFMGDPKPVPSALSEIFTVDEVTAKVKPLIG